MSLTIFKKFSINAVDLSTNKGQKPKLVSIPIKNIAKEYKELGIVILNPTIDRLQFGFYPDDKLFKKNKISEAEWMDFEKHLTSSVFAEAKYPGADYIDLQKGVYANKPPYNKYNIHLLFKPGKGCEPINIQVAPKLGGYPFIRFDMNPNRITEAGMNKFWGWIAELFVLPGATISKSDFLRWSRIKELELAVEILGARPSDLVVKSVASGKEKYQKNHTYNSESGRIETHYPNAKKKNTEYVYDKRQEMLDADLKPLYGDARHSRAEFRITNSAFYKLPTGKNRFKRLGIKALDLKGFDDLDYERKLFVLVAMDRNLDKAAALIPPVLRPKYKAIYTKLMNEIWLPDLLWKKWQVCLAKSGFVDFD